MSSLGFFFRAGFMFVGIGSLIPAVCALYPSQMKQDVAEARLLNAKENQVEKRACFLESCEDTHAGSAAHEGGCCHDKGDAQKKNANAGDAQKEESKRKDARKTFQTLNKEKHELIKEYATAQIGSLSNAFRKTSTSIRTTLGDYSGAVLRAIFGEKTSIAKEHDASRAANTVAQSASKATPLSLTDIFDIIAGGLGYFYGHQIGIPMDKWLGPITSATYILKFAGEMLCGGYKVPDNSDEAQDEAQQEAQHESRQCIDPNAAINSQEQVEHIGSAEGQKPSDQTTNCLVKLGNYLLYVHWWIGHLGAEKEETYVVPTTQSQSNDTAQQPDETTAEEEAEEDTSFNSCADLYKYSRRVGLFLCYGSVGAVYLPPIVRYFKEELLSEGVQTMIHYLTDWNNWVSAGFDAGVVFSWVFHATDPVYQYYNDESEQKKRGKRHFWNNLYFGFHGVNTIKTSYRDAYKIIVATVVSCAPSLLAGVDIHWLLEDAAPDTNGSKNHARKSVQDPEAVQHKAGEIAKDFFPLVGGLLFGVLSSLNRGLSWPKSVSDLVTRDSVTVSVTPSAEAPAPPDQKRPPDDKPPLPYHLRGSGPPRPKRPPKCPLFFYQFVHWLLYLFLSLIFYYGTVKQGGLWPECLFSFLTSKVMSLHSMQKFTYWFGYGTSFVSCYQMLETLNCGETQDVCCDRCKFLVVCRNNVCCAFLIGSVMGVNVRSQCQR